MKTTSYCIRNNHFFLLVAMPLYSWTRWLVQKVHRIQIFLLLLLVVS